jgi:hypothetical protein
LERVITAAEFCNLLVSHRRMIRSDQRGALLRGLQDLDSGEIFYTDERRLLAAVNKAPRITAGIGQPRSRRS